MNLQSSTLHESSESTKADDPYEELLKSYVEYRVCIARTMQLSESAPAKRHDHIVSASSLKVHGHQSAGVGIEFKACIAKLLVYGPIVN